MPISKCRFSIEIQEKEEDKIRRATHRVRPYGEKTGGHRGPPLRREEKINKTGRIAMRPYPPARSTYGAEPGEGERVTVTMPVWVVGERLRGKREDNKKEKIKNRTRPLRQAQGRRRASLQGLIVAQDFSPAWIRARLKPCATLGEKTRYKTEDGRRRKKNCRMPIANFRLENKRTPIR